jgi:hypothetical protein
MMEKVVITVLFIFNFTQILSSFEIESCYKTFLETSKYNQSEYCTELFEGHLKTYNNILNIILQSDDDEACIRGILDVHNFDKVYLRAIARRENDFSFSYKAIIKDLKLFKADALKYYCNPEILLKKAIKYSKSMKPELDEIIHEEFFLLKYLADHEFFKVDLIQSNSEIMSVGNCDIDDTLENFHTLPESPPDTLFGYEFYENVECIEDSLIKYEPFTNLIAYSIILEKVKQTAETQTELENYKVKVLKSVSSHVNETISCYSNMILENLEG